MDSVVENNIEVPINNHIFDFFGNSSTFFQEGEELRGVFELIKRQENLFLEIEKIVSCADQVNRSEDKLTLLKEKLDLFKDQESNDNSHQSPIFPDHIKEQFQELIQKTPTRCGSYKTSLQNCEDPNILAIANALDPNFDIEDEENKSQGVPKFAYSGVMELESSEKLVALFGVQTAENKLEMIMAYLRPDSEANELEVSSSDKKYLLEKTFQHITVILEGYSTRETTIVGFDFFKNETTSSKHQELWVLVATADGSICSVDLCQSNRIIGYDSMSIIRLDVDRTIKTMLPARKDFTRMGSTSLEALPLDTTSDEAPKAKLIFRFQDPFVSDKISKIIIDNPVVSAF